MNKFIVVPVSALLLLISVAMRGQTPSILLMAKDTSFRQSHSMILAGGSGAIGSNAMDIAFLKKMAWGGHIEPDHIDRISNRMKDINRFGMNGGLNLQFLGFSDSLFKHPDWGMKVLA
ncbi:MAG: hypothetical protein IT223_11785, partial [Crocinitomicaceae bacterium]|nr:hypothetical protein [Crocinitomicaceae bacterium]